jgi:hypothetical protein
MAPVSQGIEDETQARRLDGVQFLGSAMEQRPAQSQLQLMYAQAEPEGNIVSEATLG